MKHAVTLAIAIGLLLTSCDNPVGDKPADSLPLQQKSSISKAPPSNSFTLRGVDPDTIRSASWRQFKAKNGNDWRIRWNKHTGLPASIFSGLTRAYPGGAEQAARSFMKEYRALFGVSDVNNLKHVKTVTHRGIRHVTFNQMVKGIPVYEAEYKVHIRPGGQIDMANGTYYPNIEIGTRASISAAKAINTAKADIGLAPDVSVQADKEKVIYRKGESFYLAWKLTVSSRAPVTDWFYIIDAQSGAVLYKLNQLTNVTGDGDVYPTHPGLSSVENNTFYRLNGDGKLNGLYAKIVNDRDPEAFSSTNSFRFDPDNTHFDEGNLYYHIDQFRHNFIGNLDVDGLEFTKITAHAHTPLQDLDNDGDLDPNAWFSRSNQGLFFNDAYPPAGTNDFAKEDKVIQHEYSHAVIIDINNDMRSEASEEGAINEGTPDYLAGTFTGRPQIGDFAIPFALRDMSNPDINDYNEFQSFQDPPNAHTGGEFFSAILWDIRNSSVGVTTTDFLTYDALFRITGNPDFLAFRDAMMAADDAAFGGQHNDDIQDGFAARGVGEFAPLVVIDGPGSVNHGEQNTWTAIPDEDLGNVTYEWFYKESINAVNWSSTGVTTKNFSWTFFNDSSELQAKGIRVTVTDGQQSGADSLYITVVPGGPNCDPGDFLCQ